MEKNVLIVENSTESLIKEQSQNTSKILLSGIFTEFDVENRNKRFYKADNFVPCMEALLEKKKMLGVLYGEFDHPDVFDIAGKNISHAIESLTHNENSNRIDGSIAILSTHWGKEARAIINDGYPLFVSSRAAGVTEGNGVVSLKELFTYDIVVDPGFASAQVSVNESLGYKSTLDVPYRIYEMKDGDVNRLFNDNKNDNKTKMDIKHMEQFLANELVKIEHQLSEKIKSGKSSTSELIALSEKYELVNTEMNHVKEYLTFLKNKVSYLIKENSKLTKENSKLNYEVNENIAYSNHIASQLKNLNKNTIEIESRLSVDEKMIEYVAEHAKANILFSEDIANNVSKLNENIINNTEFLEYVASETDITQKFAESIATETHNTQKFAEYIAEATNDTQGFLEYVANEKHKDEIYLNYIAEKVDGIITYTNEMVNRTKSSVPLNENSNDDTIHNIEGIDTYLGIDKEQEIANNVEIQEEEQEEQENTEVQEVELNNQEQQEQENTEVQLNNQEQEIEIENNIETDLLNAIVKILSTDETGVIIEITPENKIIIQKSGSEETMELSEGEYELLNTEENITEKVESVLAEIKKQKVLANQQPHFFSFLSEQQIADFNVLDSATRETIVLTMNESEYYNENDVLTIIGNTINKKTMSYEERIVSAIPEEIKESWNIMTQDQKVSIITESKYFPLITKSDIQNFWKTRPFAKAVLSPESTLIKETINIKDNDSLDENYVDAFLKSYKNL